MLEKEKNKCNIVKNILGTGSGIIDNIADQVNNIMEGEGVEKLNSWFYGLFGMGLLTEKEFYPGNFFIKKSSIVGNHGELSSKDIRELNKVVYKHR